MGTDVSTLSAGRAGVEGRVRAHTVEGRAWSGSDTRTLSQSGVEGRGRAHTIGERCTCAESDVRFLPRGQSRDARAVHSVAGEAAVSRLYAHNAHHPGVAQAIRREERREEQRLERRAGEERSAASIFPAPLPRCRPEHGDRSPRGHRSMHGERRVRIGGPTRQPCPGSAGGPPGRAASFGGVLAAAEHPQSHVPPASCSTDQAHSCDMRTATVHV